MHRDDLTEKLFGQLSLHLNLGLIVDVASQRVGHPMFDPMDMAADDTIDAASGCLGGHGIGERADVLHCVLDPVLEIGREDQYWYRKRRRMILK